MSIFKKLAGQTAIYGLLTIAARFINYLLVPLHTSYMSIPEYGVVGDVYAIIAFFMVIVTYGMETTFFNFTRKKEEVSKVFGTSITLLHISSFLLFIFGFIFRNEIASFIDYAGKSEYVFYMLILLAFDAMSAIPLAYYRKIEKIWKFTLIRVSGILISVILNVYFIALNPWFLENGYEFLSWVPYDRAKLIDYVFIANCISSIWVYFWVLPTILKLKFSFDKKMALKILNYTWPLLFVGMAGIINETMDRTMLRRMLPDGEYQTGVYNAFYKLSIVITLMIQAFRMGAEPFFFAQLESKNKEKVYAMILKYFVYATVLVFLLTSLFAEPVAKLLIKQEGYFLHPTGLLIVPILLLANVFLGMHYNLSIWYKAEEMTRKGAWIAIFGAAITLIINIIFIPIYGVVASAVATLACYSGMTVINYKWGQKYFKVPYPMKRIATIILTAAIIVGGFMWADYQFDLSSGVKYGLGTLLFIAYTLAWWNMEKAELKALL